MDAGAIRMSLRLESSPESAGIARRAVRAALGHSVDDRFANAAMLCTSELVTNAIVHAGDGCGLQVCFDPPSGGVLRVEVSDDSQEQPHVVPPGDVWRIGGRGLQIVEQASTRWGTQDLAPGKVVWFELGPAGRHDGRAMRA